VLPGDAVVGARRGGFSDHRVDHGDPGGDR
jgi:hypothetical protein